MWIENGWRLVGQQAHKTLIARSEELSTRRAELYVSKSGYSEGGRLKASMEVPNARRA